MNPAATTLHPVRESPGIISSDRSSFDDLLCDQVCGNILQPLSRPAADGAQMGVGLLLGHRVSALQDVFRPRRQRARFDFLFQFVPNLFEDSPGRSGTQYSLDVLRNRLDYIRPAAIFEKAAHFCDCFANNADISAAVGDKTLHISF
jgi:hypothetical protein